MTCRSLCFVVESGTDVRLVDGLAERFALSIVARTIPGGVSISRRPKAAVPTVIGPAGRFAFARFVRRHLSSTVPHPDILLVQGYGPAALAVNSVARRAGTGAFMLVCSPVEEYYRCRRGLAYPGKPYRWSQLQGLRILARLNARWAGGYVVLSRHLADVVRSHGTAAPVHVVPVYGVDTDHFRPADRPRAQLKRLHGLPAAGTLIFFSSRIAPEKDAETLLAAVRRLIDAGRDVRVLHRSGGHAEFLVAARRAGIADRVIATDARHPHEGLRDDYQASDLCVQASRAEGLGFSPLEALACGTPVVASAVGGLVETIVPGETGWTYPAGDVGALAAAIAEIIDAPGEAARRAARGRELVRTHFERRLAFDTLERVLASDWP